MSNYFSQVILMPAADSISLIGIETKFGHPTLKNAPRSPRMRARRPQDQP
jgi:hypothetical protein